MTKHCEICRTVIQDGDRVEARVLAYYKVLPSRVAYAITQPFDCLEVVHEECAGRLSLGDTN